MSRTPVPKRACWKRLFYIVSVVGFKHLSVVQMVVYRPMVGSRKVNPVGYCREVGGANHATTCFPNVISTSFYDTLE